ncbi:C40 family peptidase [Aridibaculum aurantiacum]|uniref:C40 family peptidase n=1 Tax=Aridibaculum aurantiacum TaxID=2810307 RepID=UPI001A972DC2|nr:SH3 domain-containing C40 family peptidase [Aridibaculum aurantiacum]
MNKAICVVPVSPMRAAPSHKTEQVSQLVFGDVVEILERETDFFFINNIYDGYKGWCPKVHLQHIEDEAAFFPAILTNKWVTTVYVNNAPMQLPLGSNIGFIKNGAAYIGPLHFSTIEEGLAVPSKPDLQLLQQYAMLYMNTSYQWGGRTVFGVDCSGYTQMLYKLIGVPLLRDASQQATQGEVVDFIQEVRTGDLAFFDNEEGHIMHVGVMLSSNSIIHASGKVRIDTMDQAGILNRETGERSHKLRIIKRIL